MVLRLLSGLSRHLSAIAGGCIAPVDTLMV